MSVYHRADTDNCARSHSPHTHVFGMWKEPGVPRKNIQTRHRRDSEEFKPEDLLLVR